MPQTLYDKLWDSHLVTTRDDGKDLIYIDRHILHEVTTPQAFAGLEKAQRLPWRITPNLATLDHSIPTTNHSDGIEKIADKFARLQVQTLEKNCKKYGITQYSLGDIEQGIVHVMAPEQGAILPGMTVVCGDSHTSTHGAFAAMAQGIGTSEVEHVLATQCLAQKKLANMQINFTGSLQAGVTAKDMILALIAKIGTAGGTGYAMEFTGEAIAQLSMEERMTICNMSIEAGSKVGLVAVDDTTVAYLKDKTFAPTGNQWERAVTYWQSLTSDKNAVFDKTIHIDVTNLSPQVTWGTSPQMTIGIDETIPSLDNSKLAQDDYASALNYMDVQQGKKITDYGVDVVFIGSCTNSRIEDLREAASIAKNGKVNPNTEALVVAGSGQVKRQAEQEGLDKIFIQAGFEWRDPGCSMCIAMNPDKLKAGQRSASTSNRNFIGRQGFGGRTHLVSPAMAAAAALAGKFVDVRKYYS